MAFPTRISVTDQALILGRSALENLKAARRCREQGNPDGWNDCMTRAVEAAVGGMCLMIDPVFFRSREDIVDKIVAASKNDGPFRGHSGLR